ncbi:AAA family ATPase [Acidaminococcus intestini]|uniref:AAA family ATPase n=1 Tax=Acidaminococcus intestini TaxID=187327 RepID=UPI00265E3432|nr:AAA family ATPase [Acidaminococcus intestini]
MKLISLALQNFKGIKSFTLQGDGASVTVYGDNGTGKSTLFDAFTWLLFGKNSKDEKDFGIKTLDECGSVIPRIDHSVSAIIDHDGQQIQLTRTYKERWRKQRGAAEAVLVGNTTEYLYGPAGSPTPISATQYAEVISKLIPEKLFKLITDPTYFNDKLTWQERRQIVMQLCGDVTDDEIVKSDASLAEVLQLAAGRSIDDTKKGIRAAIRETGRKKDEIGPRVDECRKGLADITVDAVTSARLAMTTLPDQIAQLQQQKTAEAKMDPSIKAREKLAAISARITDLKAARQEQAQKAKAALSDATIAASRKIAQVRMQLDKLTDEQGTIQGNVDRINKNLDELRHSFVDVRGKQFVKSEIETVCPTCGQELPPDRIEKARQTLEQQEAEFNSSKAEILKRINIEGKAKNAELAKLTERLKDLEAEITAAINNLDKCNAEYLEAADAENSFEIPASEEEKKLIQEAMEIKAHADQPVDTAELDQKIEALTAKLEAAKAINAKADANNQLNARISALLKSESDLSAHLIDLERQMYLCEQFVRAKTDLVARKIAEKIPNVQFVMFRPNITNEGIEECCETCYHGVPYQDLNTGARLNVGLEIINALIAEYKVSAPIFVDNAESIVQLVDTPAQLIRLVVSEADKSLRVEKEN